MHRKLFLFLFSITGFAQNCPKPSEENMKALELQESAQLVTNLNYLKINQSTSCGEIQEEQNHESEMVCVGDPIDLKNFNIMTTTFETNNLPAEIKNFLPGELLTANKGITLVIAEENDNSISVGVARRLWMVISGDDYMETMSKIGGGDDSGNTHGMKLTASKVIKDAYTLKLDFGTSLFAQDLRDEEGNYLGERRLDLGEERNFFKQNFTNEMVAKLWVDNIPKGKSSYYRAGVGFIKIDSVNSKGLLTGTGQQDTWHRKALNIFAYENVARPDLGTRASPDFEAFLGLQLNIINPKSTCRLRLATEAGARLNGVGAHYLQGGASQFMYFQRKNSRVAASIGFDEKVILHQGGAEASYTCSGNVQFGAVGIGFEHNQVFGKALNHVTFNTTNPRSGKYDSTFKLKLNFIIGGKLYKKKN